MNSYAFCYVVLDDADYLHYSLLNISASVRLHPNSRIVIVEADNLTNGTQDIIKYWLVNGLPGRILYDRIKKTVYERDARNHCLELVRQNFNVSHIVNLEAHDFIIIDDFWKIDEYITENVNHLTFWLPKISFWGNFQTICKEKPYVEKIITNCWNFKYSHNAHEISIANQLPFHKQMIDSTGYLKYPFYNCSKIRPDKRLSEHSRPDTERSITYPSELLNHPRFNMTKEEIWDSPELFPTFMP